LDIIITEKEIIEFKHSKYTLELFYFFYSGK